MSDSMTRHIGIREAVAERPGQFPVLELALRDSTPADGLKVEWLRRKCLHCGSLSADFNYMQIFRDSNLERLLSDVEDQLASDYPPNRSGLWSEMGGVRYYLARPPVARDRISLRILRDLVEIRHLERERRPDYLVELTVTVRDGLSP